MTLITDQYDSAQSFTSIISEHHAPTSLPPSPVHWSHVAVLNSLALRLTVATVTISHRRPPVLSAFMKVFQIVLHPIFICVNFVRFRVIGVSTRLDRRSKAWKQSWRRNGPCCRWMNLNVGNECYVVWVMLRPPMLLRWKAEWRVKSAGQFVGLSAVSVDIDCRSWKLFCFINDLKSWTICLFKRATEPGFAGDIDTIEVWLIDWNVNFDSIPCQICHCWISSLMWVGVGML